MDKNDNWVRLEQIMAGALLKFDKVDALDRALLVQDFEEKTGARLLYVDHFEHIYKYIERNEHSIWLREELTLNSRLMGESTTLRKKLVTVAGDIVNNYFKKFNLEKFKKQKEKKFNTKKRVLQGHANILLISECEEDYERLKEYGFKNISYFKSIVRAYKYLDEHDDEINNYDIIIRGRHSVFRDYPAYHLKQADQNNDLVVYDVTAYSKDEVYAHLFIDRKFSTSYGLKKTTYENVLDNIVINCINNGFLEVSKKRSAFEPIKDYINPNKLELPKLKSDLKILFLGSCEKDDCQKIALELGLDVCWVDDNNSALYKHVEKRLGEFDIIVATQRYSHMLLYMNHESTEQCKDTGRRFTTLVVYRDKEMNIIGQGDYIHPSYYANEIELGYSFGGELGKGLKYESKKYKSLICSSEELTASPLYRFREKIFTKNVLEEAVNIYSDTLKQLEQPGIVNLDFNSSDDYDKEYKETYDKEEREKGKFLEPISDYNRLVSTIAQYLKYRENGYIREPLVGLRIREVTGGIYIENISQGRILCAMTIPLNYSENDLRVFSVQCLNKKGVLGKPEIVGLYTKRHEQFSVPKRPDDKQMSVIEAIEKKVEVVIGPQNDRAYDIKHEIYGNRNRCTGARVYSKQTKKY